MIKTAKHSLWALTLISSSAAADLTSSVRAAIATNPDIQVQISEMQTSQQDVKIARSAYFPSLDLTADTGKDKIEHSTASPADTDLTRSTASLQLTVPLFRGFASKNGVAQADLTAQASYYQALSTAQDIALQISRNYLEMLKAQEIVELAKTNLETHRDLLKLVDQKTRQGASDKADLAQIKGRLARARSNLLSAENNYLDAQTNFYALTQQSAQDLVKPQVADSDLPASLNDAKELATKQHPAMLAAQLNSESSMAAQKSTRSAYYPDFDFVVDRSMRKNVNGNEWQDDETSMLLKMRWNLYHGGADHANKKKSAYRYQQSLYINERTQREVIANADSSWNAFITLNGQNKWLKDYVEQTETTSRLYRSQFSVRKRTLLDLLDSANELFQARQELLTNDYDRLYADFRVLSSVGELLKFFGLEVDESGTSQTIEANAETTTTNTADNSDNQSN